MCSHHLAFSDTAAIVCKHRNEILAEIKLYIFCIDFVIFSLNRLRHCLTSWRNDLYIFLTLMSVLYHDVQKGQ